MNKTKQANSTETTIYRNQFEWAFFTNDIHIQNTMEVSKVSKVICQHFQTQFVSASKTFNHLASYILSEGTHRRSKHK